MSQARYSIRICRNKKILRDRFRQVAGVHEIAYKIYIERMF